MVVEEEGMTLLKLNVTMQGIRCPEGGRSSVDRTICALAVKMSLYVRLYISIF